MRFALVSIALTGCVAEDGSWFPTSEPPSSEPPSSSLPPTAHLDGLTPTGGCGWYHCTIAAGGRDQLTLSPLGTTFDLASGPIRLERVGQTDVIELTAITTGPGTANLDLVVPPTPDWPAQHQPEQLAAATVAKVSLIPEWDYQANGPLAYAVQARDVVFAIESTPVLTVPTNRLVDATLHVTGADALAWDHYRLPAGLGTHTVAAAADSFTARSFDVTIVDGIDRITAVADAPVAHVGDSATVCFHAYHGELEVYAPFETALSGHVDLDGEPTINCRYLVPADAGHYAVTGTALGMSATFAVDVTP